MNKIYWKEVVSKLKVGEAVEKYEVDFNSEQIHFKDVALLNRHGFSVPEELIYYNDDDIDFGDDPEWTDDEINEVIQTTNLAATLPVSKEIREWIKKEKIDINILAARLIKNFYETVKNVQKNAALQ